MSLTRGLSKEGKKFVNTTIAHDIDIIKNKLSHEDFIKFEENVKKYAMKKKQLLFMLKGLSLYFYVLSKTNMNNKPPIIQISLNQIYRKFLVSSNLSKHFIYIVLL